MAKRDKKHARRLRNLVMLCTMCAVVLTVSTYAWFIGMKTVNVSAFEVEIATTEGLWLSMDGVNWTYKLDAKNTTAYDGNTNSWADGANEGLIPMSTVGDMDSTVSRMKLYEKASLTTTPGGFRLLTSRVDNYSTVGTGSSATLSQGKGYVVFDLFVKNLSGEYYYEESKQANEEAIYLTTNSIVKVADSGVEKTGIENSVRVAFVQVGRVKADTGEDNAAAITGITCSDATVGGIKVTGICRDAQIWEPNDKNHVGNAISWYDTACATRKSSGSDVTLKASYNIATEDTEKTRCATVENGKSYDTYAVTKPIEIIDNVDVYDGEDYNGYTANNMEYDDYVDAGKTGAKLVNFPYFKDSDKILTGTDRPTFMTLAPNSITKLRVYVYIEGQDIDNYDFASLGKKISVNFGFTKERFTEDDIEYDGPPTGTVPTPSDEVGTPADDATPSDN